METNVYIAVVATLEATHAGTSPVQPATTWASNNIEDLDAIGEFAQFPEEVVSVLKTMSGINLAEVHQVWRKKFDPLNLSKLLRRVLMMAVPPIPLFLSI